MTLVETVVAAGLVALIATLGLQMVFLTDRALARETKRSEADGGALTLVARLRDDLQLARQLALPQPSHLLVTLLDGTRVEYRAEATGMVRLAGTTRESFPRLQASFGDSTARLVRVDIRHAAGPSLNLTIHPRNAPSAKAQAGGGGPPPGPR